MLSASQLWQRILFFSGCAALCIAITRCDGIAVPCPHACTAKGGTYYGRRLASRREQQESSAGDGIVFCRASRAKGETRPQSARQERQSGDGHLGVRTRRSALLRIWRHIRHCGTRVTDRRRGLHRGIRSRFLRTCDEAVELPALQALRTGAARRPHCLAAATRHTALPTSSATSSPPLASSATPTGRPQASPSSLTKPVSTSSGMPCGLPLANGTKMTL